MNALPFEIKIRILCEYDGRWYYSHSRKRWIEKINKETDDRYKSLKERYLPYSIQIYATGMLHTTWMATLSTIITEECKKYEYTAYYTEYDIGKDCKNIIVYEWSQKYLHIDEYGNNTWNMGKYKTYRIAFS